MKLETITEQDDLVIQKMTLLPGEAGHWHTDTCSRFTVIVAGDKLGIEFRNQMPIVETTVGPGATGWDEPENQIHRAVNIGLEAYVEVVTFYRDSPSIVPQPRHP